MKILLIEDEAAIRETLQELLELNGHTVLAAPDGPSGVQLAAQRPDLILCDVGLPGLDGYGVISAVQRMPECRDIPFIFLTARAERQDQRRGMALGADDYITKPFTEREIMDAIAARVHRQQPLRERLGALLAERRGEIGANWSHELMTPMNAIIGGLEMIEAEAATIQPADLKELLRLIRGGAERQLALSRKLIRYFELEQLKGGPPDARQGCCPGEAAVMTGAARAAEAAGGAADLTVRAEPGEVSLPETHLATAVTELVENALRFSRPSRPVAVTASRQGDRYVIAVSDQGPGLTAEQCARIGPFIQFGRDKREQQGLGLGLAIARDVAEIAGGRLDLQPGTDGRGLRAVLDLPCGG